jgi:hypothetical protein
MIYGAAWLKTIYEMKPLASASAWSLFFILILRADQDNSRAVEKNC